MIPKNISINYKRLERHYKLNLENYDEISLLDMAHCLRLWMDMREEVDIYFKSLSPQVKFNSSRVSKKLIRLARNNEYILAGIPAGGVACAGTHEMMGSDFKIGDDYTLGFKIMRDEKDYIHYGDIIFINGMGAGKEHTNTVSKGYVNTRTTFSNWLNSDIVRVNFRNAKSEKERKIISRFVFVNRVANILGGSHPVGSDESENQFNEAIRHLMGFRFAGLPTPYFLLMKVAKDILDSVTLPNNK